MGAAPRFLHVLPPQKKLSSVLAKATVTDKDDMKVVVVLWFTIAVLNARSPQSVIAAPLPQIIFLPPLRDTTKPGLWTMDWTVDWTMDRAFLIEMSSLAINWFAA